MSTLTRATATATSAVAATNQDEEQTYRELNEFLLSPRVDVRLAATEAVLVQTATSGGGDGDGESSSSAAATTERMSKLIRNGCVAPIAKCASHSDADVSINALRALVRLTSESGPAANQCVADLVDETAGGMNRMLEIALSSPPSVPSSGISSGKRREAGAADEDEGDASSLRSWRQRVNLATALLANMTRMENAAVELVGRTLPDEPVFRKRLTESSSGGGDGENDKDDGGDDNNKMKDLLQNRPTLDLLLARFLNDRYRNPDVNYSAYEADDGEEEEVVVAARGADGDDDGGTRIASTASASSAAAAELDSRCDDPYQHFAAVLMNATLTEVGRKFLLRLHYPQRQQNGGGNPAAAATSVLQRLLPQLQSPNPLRRRGIAGTVRNCCLSVDSAWWMLNEVKLHKHVLLPLAGPEELDVEEKQGLDPDLWLQGPDKKREPDRLTRLFLVESILLLCATGRKSRERLRLDRTYVVLKYADMVEPSEDVSEQINECVQYLRRDEEGTQDGSSDRMVQDAYPKLRVLRERLQLTATSAPTTTTAATASRTSVVDDEDFDNVD